MGRKRTIDPAFWTDAKVTECSLNARLLLIGAWNFADDEGNLPRTWGYVKARVFPFDDVDCEALLLELIEHRLMAEYAVEGQKYLHIQNFKRDQLVNRPSKPRYPEYPREGHRVLKAEAKAPDATRSASTESADPLPTPKPEISGIRPITPEWAKSNIGIINEASNLGIEMLPGESFKQLAQRIMEMQK